MAELTNREIVERFAQSQTGRDLDLQDQYLADDIVEDYPQSGERIRGKANRRATIENYPGRAEREFGPSMARVVGGEDQWVLTPTLSLMKVKGSGDHFTGVGEITYPNGETWHIVQLLEMRNGKISHITSYFGKPFEPPPWRAKWVERMPSPK